MPKDWRNTVLPAGERARNLLAQLSLEEKVAQLSGVWVGADSAGAGVAPHQHDLADAPIDWPGLIKAGLGQLTRPFGTAPVDAALGAQALARAQREIVAAGRHGIPAMAHEECLSGFMAWGATVYPTPLAWGASFDPHLVERMAEQIGTTMRSLGVHQGLAPVLDVTRDYRWGRTEETIGEDPYLVATIATAYVRGLESTGVVATLKHFVGYSASRSGRNFAPVSAGQREIADVLLPPFEMALRDGAARSVMHSYAEIDGMPVAADPALLTGLLRDDWQFDGTVVADYFGISFLHKLHHVASDEAGAASLALAAGVDVELPTVNCYGQPLLDAVLGGRLDEALVDRAVVRVLTQKCQLGLLDPQWCPEPDVLRHLPHGIDADAADVRGTVNLDPEPARALARELAEESVVLVANDGVLPLAASTRIAVVGPLADDIAGMLGCYSFPSHIGNQFPGVPTGPRIATQLESLGAEFPAGGITHVAGCDIDGDDTSNIAAAVEAARDAEACVVVLGDRAGLFGRGTSGEGCDAVDLTLPGVQGQLLDAVLAVGTPVVLVLLAGRPYALGAYAGRVSAVVQAFFPGEEGGDAVAGVLSGRVCPSGRLPVSIPATPGGQPGTYLTARLGQRSDVSSVDPTPQWAFGHGLSYTTFDWTDVQVDDAAAHQRVDVATDGTVLISMTVHNTGPCAGAEIVQLYLSDPVAQVTRPAQRLIGYGRVHLEAGRSARLTFDVAADLTSFTGRAGQRIVEPGDIELSLAASSTDVRHRVALRLIGPERVVDRSRALVAHFAVQ
ncbi:MAG: glycoside hydrolase family 3 N-terminal domain-containing protein [Mycobacteriales bacterium]